MAPGANLTLGHMTGGVGLAFFEVSSRSYSQNAYVWLNTACTGACFGYMNALQATGLHSFVVRLH